MSTRGKLFFAFLIAVMLFTSVGTAVVALAAGPGEVNFDGWALCPGMTERNPTQARLLIYNTDTTPEEALAEPAGAVGMITFDGHLFGGSFSLSSQADYTIVMISGNARVANTVTLYTATDVTRPENFCNGPSIGTEAVPTEPAKAAAPIAVAAEEPKKVVEKPAAPATRPAGATGVATTTVEVGLPAAIELTAVRNEIRAGETTVLTATVLDDNGFAVTDPVTVTFASESGTIGEAITKDGAVAIEYSSKKAGAQTVGAYFETTGAETQLATTGITVTAGAPMTATVILGPLEPRRSMQIAVVAIDQYGNEVLNFNAVLTTNNGILEKDHGTATDGVFVTMLRKLQPGDVEVTAVVTEPTAPTAKAAAGTEAVEVEIAGDVDTLYEAWTQAYGTAPTHDQWTAYAAAHDITITDAGVPIVHFGDVLTFEVPVDSTP